MAENITFRSLLMGNISDFCESCSMGDLLKPSIFVELIGILSRYKEEGVSLSPEVYICSDLKTFLQLLPGCDSITIGCSSNTDTGIKEALKKCASLAIEGWNIFIEEQGETFNFGLFRDSLEPLNLSVEDTVLNGSIKVVMLHQAAEDCVEVKSHSGFKHYIFLSHKKETTPAPDKYLNDLVGTICERVKPEIKESTCNFIKKTIKSSLKASHGTLIAVLPGVKIPKSFDGIHLLPPIDFPFLVSELQNKSISSVALGSEASLLKGMVNCDGIVVFNCFGKLLGYNCFINTPKVKTGVVVGGARRRAYETLVSKLGKGVNAAYIQSQDGWADFKKVKI